MPTLSEKSFASFVDCSCTFSNLWGCKLRNFAAIFGNYPKLQELKISLMKAVDISKDIDRALVANKKAADFWKE